MASGINLFQTKTELSPVLERVEQYVRIASLTLLVLILIGGLGIATLFFVFTKQKNILEAERQQVIGTIEGYLNKETMLFMLHERISLIDKVFGVQQSFAPFIDTTIKIIDVRPLTAFSLGDKNTVSITLSLSSMEDTVTVLSNVMVLESKGEINNATVLVLNLEGNGTVKLSISYKVIL